VRHDRFLARCALPSRSPCRDGQKTKPLNAAKEAMTMITKKGATHQAFFRTQTFIHSSEMLSHPRP
jgi:hypothetical protein